MISLWDYADTELPFTDTGRSRHMKDMGSKGWELVSVSSNPLNGSHIYFWKRPLRNNTDEAFPTDSPMAEKRSQQLKKTVGDDADIIKPMTENTHNFIQNVSVPNYKIFPKPQVIMVVKYRPKEGCFEEFRDELYKRNYPNCITRHMGFNNQNEFVCVSLMESVDAALDLEGVGTNWLDSVDHLLVKYPNGSRTESFSGPVWDWCPNYENLQKFDNKPSAFTVIIVKMKEPKIEETKKLIINSSNELNKLFTCIAQYRDSNDTYIHVGLDDLEDRIDANEYFQNGYNKQLANLVIREESREFFSGPEDFVWFNSKYLQE
tara:strand:- start:42 stop:998 length:957 start_codon:yes stop_codon:yes gene_type:complete